MYLKLNGHVTRKVTVLPICQRNVTRKYLLVTSEKSDAVLHELLAQIGLITFWGVKTNLQNEMQSMEQNRTFLAANRQHNLQNSE